MKNEITAKRLSLALSNVNMRPQELAERSGVSKSSISQYINGLHAPSNISSKKMASVLGVNPLWLMGFDVKMKKNIIILDKFSKEFLQRDEELDESLMMHLEAFFPDEDLANMDIDKRVELYNSRPSVIIYEEGCNGIEMIPYPLTHRKLLNFYQELNNLGKVEALKRVAELTYNPKYTEPDTKDSKKS